MAKFGDSYGHRFADHGKLEITFGIMTVRDCIDLEIDSWEIDMEPVSSNSKAAALCCGIPYISMGPGFKSQSF